MATLPYPHARNDCALCGAMDADIQLIGDGYNTRPAASRFCQRCVGKHLALLVLTADTRQPVTEGVEGPSTATRLASDVSATVRRRDGRALSGLTGA